MTTDLITALQTHGQQHKGTDLGGVLQWAILHIQSQAEAKQRAQPTLAVASLRQAKKGY